MQKKFKVRMGCTVPSPLTWPSTKKSDGTEELVMTGSVDGCSVPTKSQNGEEFPSHGHHMGFNL